MLDILILTQCYDKNAIPFGASAERQLVIGLIFFKYILYDL